MGLDILDGWSDHPRGKGGKGPESAQSPLPRELARHLARIIEARTRRAPPGVISAALPDVSVFVQEITPSVENRRVWVVFKVRNNRDFATSGRVHGRISLPGSNAPVAVPINYWELPEIRPRETRLGVLSFIAPEAAMGYVVESFHVHETRSPQTDTISIYGPGLREPIGDVTSGDGRTIGKSLPFHADFVPSDEGQMPFPVVLFNKGDIHTKKEAEDFAAGLNLLNPDLISALSALLNLAGNSQDDPSGNSHWDIPLGVSVLFILSWGILAHLWALDCNGEVAYIAPVVTGRELLEATKGSDSWTITETYRGTSSPDGCGDSVYDVPIRSAGFALRRIRRACSRLSPRLMKSRFHPRSTEFALGASWRSRVMTRRLLCWSRGIPRA